MKKKKNFLKSDGDERSTKVEKVSAKYHKYCPLIFVDAKKTFSIFKMMLENKRQIITVKNAEKYTAV